EEDPVEGDLSIAVETADPGGVVGEASGYTLRITNNGDQDVQGVRLDEYVLGYRNAQYEVDGGPSGYINSSTVTRINIGTIEAGESRLVEISGIVQAAGQTISTSEVSSDFVLDPDSTNNTLVQYRNGDVAVIDQADVSLTGTVSNANPVAGDTVTLTVDLNNLGPNVASGLQ